MFARFVMKAVPKMIANPVLAAEMAPVLIAVGTAVAIHDLMNR